MEEIDPKRFEEFKEKAHTIYTAQRTVSCPYFKTDVILNSDGFHHLQFSARRERNKREQLLKFRLLPLALQVIKKSGTVQEYRKMLTPIGSPSKRDGAVAMKQAQYWGFVAIVGDNPIRIRVITRQIGDGNITFWSVMPHTKIQNGIQKLFGENIEDEE